MDAIHVLIVDDHPAVRLGVRTLLEKGGDIQVTGEVGTGDEALRLVNAKLPDIVLLDMELPDMDGPQVAAQLKEKALPVSIIGFSAYDDIEYIQAMLDAGMAGYLVKDEAPEIILEAVRAVARGERGWFSRRVATQLARWVKGTYLRLGLTQREIEVCQILAQGKTNDEIGRALGISEKTVEKHLEGIFPKLGVFSRVEAAVRVVRAGLA